MKNTLKAVLDSALARGASYADVRWSDRRTETISVKNQSVDHISVARHEGIGVRVLVSGGWGFASTDKKDEAALSEAVDRAISVAKASARWKKGNGIELSPVKPVEDRYANRVKRDPFEVKPEDRISLLKDAAAAALAMPDIRIAEAGMGLFKEQKVFASTEGSYIEQSITECGAGLSITARDASGVERRSVSDYETRGYEFIESLELKPKAETLAGEASQLLRAPVCPRGKKDLIMGGSMVALQIHESCGHPIELDRVLGTESTFAGTSFLTLDKRGDFMYGSPAVTITADATIPGGLGSFGYDDEGVPAQRTVIVDKGRFENYLTSRETATMFGQTSNGTMRAVGPNNVPLIRMTNINLEPGDWTLPEIIKDTKDGIFVDTPKSWSLDDKRVNFHFGQEIAYEVKDGSLGKMLRNPAHTALTPEFWNSCDAVASRDEWKVWGTPGCAKGEPVQVIHVGHGAAPARFRGIKVGVGE